LEHLDVTRPTEAITANKLTSDPCSIASASPKDKKLADEIIVVMPKSASIPARKLYIYIYTHTYALNPQIWNGPSGDWVTNFVPKNAWFLSKR
jgi:hypothetical protein